MDVGSPTYVMLPWTYVMLPWTEGD